MYQREFMLSILMTLGCCMTCISQNSYAQDIVADRWQFEEARQFDFWIGEWDVNLRQKQPDHSWIDWKQSKAHIHRILDGRAILELWEEQSNDVPQNTIIGYSLRYYDTDQSKWILWLNWPGVNRSGSNSMAGTFRHGRGEFGGQRPLNDSVDIISRFTFSDVTPTTLRWDDAFSRDGGHTWTNNWIMEFTRTAEHPRALSGNSIHTFRSGERCQTSEFSVLNRLAGSWKGKTTSTENHSEALTITLHNYSALGGCSIMSFLTISDDAATDFKEFGLLTYNTYANKYEVGTLNNQAASSYVSYYGDYTDHKRFSLHKTNGSDGTLAETYTWLLIDDQTLEIKKSIFEGADEVVVLDAKLSRQTW